MTQQTTRIVTVIAAFLGGLVLFVLLYLVGVEQGAAAVFSGQYVHEFVHDGRHLLGFPCH